MARRLGTAHSRTLALALAAGFAAPASATWSILIADTRTGEIALGSATCVNGINLRGSTPVLVLGVGGVTAQSAVDGTGTNRAQIFDGFVRGETLQSIFDELAMTDAGHGNRQYGFITADGDTLTYSGPENAAWAGGETGRIDIDPPGPENDIVFSVQGNILTGEPVVAAAADAVRNTPGDLAEKLMAAMEAAFAFGGDGRCSCPGVDPTACGAPPIDGFDRTADVGYMLVGRVGDREQAGWFDTSALQAGFTRTGDINGDGSPDIVNFPRSTGSIEVKLNITQGPASPVLFESVIAYDDVSGITDAMLGDIDADGDDDIVYLDGQRFYVLQSNGDGTFAPIREALANFGAVSGAMGDFRPSTPGDELVVTTGLNRILTYAFQDDGLPLFVGDSGELGFVPEFGIGTTPTGIVVADNDLGLIPMAPSASGAFSPSAFIPTPGTAAEPLSGDFNGDGRLDFVYRESLTVLRILLDDGMGGYAETPVTYVTNSAQRIEDFSIADVDGDGDDDIAALPRRGRFSTTIDDGKGGFFNTPLTRILEGESIGVADFSRDGLPDFATTQVGVIGVYENAGQGLPVDDRGFAGGDYFLELNVPRSPDPGYSDPVPQLRDEFDAWRSDRVGVPDGSVSTIGDFPQRVFAGGNRTTVEFEVSVRDFAGGPITGLRSEAFSIEAPRGMPTPLMVDFAVEVFGEPGTYRVQAEPTGETGESTLWVRIASDTPSGATVSAVVQPAPAFVAAASQADFNNDGVLDLADIVAFLTAFNAQDPSADLDPDGVFNLNDVNFFIQEFLAG